jgi:hypothetical protein
MDGWTDGEPDGHRHTIIRPVFNRRIKTDKSLSYTCIRKLILNTGSCLPDCWKLKKKKKKYYSYKNTLLETIWKQWQQISVVLITFEKHTFRRFIDISTVLPGQNHVCTRRRSTRRRPPAKHQSHYTAGHHHFVTCSTQALISLGGLKI